MNIFAKVVGSVVDKFRGGSRDVIVHKSQSGAKAETSLACFAPGIEISPADGEYLVLTRIKNSSSFKVSIGGINQDVAPDVDRGERRIYSVGSDGSIAARLKWTADGDLELNDATDSAVLFSELKSGFDQLKTDLNNLVTAYNSHIHVTTATIGASTTPGVLSPTASTGTSSSASVDSSESADVKLS